MSEISDLLSKLAASKKDPEFADEMKELVGAHTHAARMFLQGKLSGSEYEDFDAYLCGKCLDALPPDQFAEGLKDGWLGDLQALAGHDGTRDVGDVEDARRDVVKAVTADVIDSAWLAGLIDAKRYAEENQNLGRDSDLSDRMADGDYDGAASEFFASRHDVATQESDLTSWLEQNYGTGKSKHPQRVVRTEDADAQQQNDLDKYLAKTYGPDEPAPSDRRPSSGSPPPGEVEHETVLSPFSSPSRRDTFIDHDARMPRDGDFFRYRRGQSRKPQARADRHANF